MATTNSDFVYTTGSNPVLNGTAVLTPPFIAAFGGKEAMAISQVDQIAGGSGAPTASNSTVAGRLLFDPALPSVPIVGTPQQVPVNYGTILGGFAKNGSVLLSLSGTTAQTIDLTNTTANTPAGTAGDTGFATVFVVRAKNLGTGTVTITQGGSNPSPIPNISGNYVLAAGSEVLFHVAAGATITSSAKTITFTPSATGVCLVTVGGA